MNTTVLTLHDVDSPMASLRCEAIGMFLCRLRQLDGQRADIITRAVGAAAAISALADLAAVIADGDDVCYVPTRFAREKVAAEEDGTWPFSIAARHRKEVRHSTGAIFRFPLVDDPDAYVEAFITDWTGVPGACAMAVHPAHRLGTGIAPGEQATFTGRFCHHPLTGDQLPIWSARWVKREFGTGAVVVNPGHNRVDLEFARSVGLPVRFALAPKEYDGSPPTWFPAPFIKSGFAVRTGIADGLPYDQVRDAYFGILAERGLAESYTDTGLGKFAIAQVADGGTEIAWDEARRCPAAEDGPAGPLRLSASPVLAAVEERLRGGELTVVTPSTRVETDLLALRLLLAEPEIMPAVKRAPEVVLVGNAMPVREEYEAGVLKLALLVNAGILETVALKPQTMEPCQRFLRVHEDLLQAEAVGSAGPSAEVGKASVRIKALLASGDLKQAFTQLYRVQKGLAKSEQIQQEDLARYFALAHALAGVRGPAGDEALAASWQQI